jgi:hypothetical protein
VIVMATMNEMKIFQNRLTRHASGGTST